MGPKRAEVLNKEFGIFKFRDLLHFYPFRYIDRTRFFSIVDIHEDLPYIQVKGRS